MEMKHPNELIQKSELKFMFRKNGVRGEGGFLLVIYIPWRREITLICKFALSKH